MPSASDGQAASEGKRRRLKLTPTGVDEGLRRALPLRAKTRAHGNASHRAGVQDRAGGRHFYDKPPRHLGTQRHLIFFFELHVLTPVADSRARTLRTSAAALYLPIQAGLLNLRCHRIQETNSING